MPDPIAVRTRRVRFALIVVAALAFVVPRLAFVSVPLERDEGEYAYIAQRMLEGDVPYRDAFDQKPPAVFVAYAGAFLLLGTSVEAIHVFAQLWSAVTTLLLFLLVRRLADETAALFAVLVFALASADASITASAANAEVFMLLPMVASLLCLERGLAAGRWGWWLACGALAASACWFKQVAATHALFVALFAASDRIGSARPGLTGLGRRYAWMGLGAALASAPWIAWLAAAGAWEPFVDAVFLHNFEYAAELSPRQGLANLRYALARMLASFGVLWLVAGVAMLRPGRLRLRPRAWAMLVAWAAASLLGVSLGLYFRPHYFIQSLPALAALCGVAFGAAARWLLARPRPGVAAAGIAALVLLVLAPPLLANRKTLLAGSPEAVSRRLYGLNPFPESLAIARYIERTSEPDDFVYVVGSEPQIFFYSGRRSATRYIFFYPLTADHPGALARQRSAIAEVEARRPLYVVRTNIPTSLLTSEGTERYVFEASDRMLQQHYRLELVARLDAGQESYQFTYGRDALRWMTEERARRRSTPWIALWRRDS